MRAGLFVLVAMLTASACSTDTFSNDAGGTDAADAPMCPDEQGLYDVTYKGSGCSTFLAATSCIQQSGCTITASDPLGGFTGMAMLAADGSFQNASVQENKVQRSGCSGAWNGVSALTVDCGGALDSGQACIATLSRKASTCP